ncbi:hypothetical protein KL905_000731 [Ogataea polymorpha]|nr:hypothetical protein KL937_001406 [Ogataea polymorpha]KAG7910546.1 hypothetical protein KL907_001437 [Ogataea polymorpha]KAG7923513.1 hypothetical protein KL905_000731 [Ogataea polymorpha]KAG7938873.1 hypothetical protein KL904_001402 [Ogataea polymorpha]
MTDPTPQPNSPVTLPDPPENPANTVPSRTLWMGDIEPWWNEEFITDVWAKTNKRVLVKVIKPRQNALVHQLAHSGYCFVEFETPEDAKEALKLNGTIIPNTTDKLFRLNWASAATLNSQIAQTPEYSLFVGDLSPATTEAHLLALFQTHFSTVKTVRVMTDPATGLSRCFGFVRFSSDEDRQKALVEMNGKWLDGRLIRVALATPKHQNQLFRKHQIPIELDPYHAPGMPPIGYYAAPQPPPAYSDPTNTTVFVGGLSNNITEATLLSIFEPYGQIVHVKVPPGKGCGFVKFTQRTEAERAIEQLQGYVIDGSRVRLSWGRSNRNHMMAAPGIAPGMPQHQPPAQGPPQTPGMMMPGMGPPMFYDPYAAESQYVDQNGQYMYLPHYASMLPPEKTDDM